MSHFEIECRACGMVLKDAYCAFCEHCSDSLLVSRYKSGWLEGSGEGIWKFGWLPVHGGSFEQAGPVVYRSEGLAGSLGLKELYIAFNGYWPGRGGYLRTCTFKEYEAAVVIQNARENNISGLVVASAGNTARAFAHLSTVSGFPAVIVVPGMCLLDMKYLDSALSVPTIALMDGDYSDSIDMARRVAMVFEMPFEGGVKNIAKRDGLGVVLLEAVSVLGRMPDRYFQAVGSGTGVVAVWEMAERFLLDGRFGSALPKLHIAQNLPFAPMVKAWERGERVLSPEELRPELIGEITTRVLSNRYPAYSLMGGVYDAMRACGGGAYGILNHEVFEAMDVFESLEGIDIAPAAGVAVAALKKAVKENHVSPHEVVLLNITGGGEKLLEKEEKTSTVDPVFVSKKISEKELEAALCNMLKTN